MSDKLTIDFRWLGGHWENAFDKAFAAEIGIGLGDLWLTELEDFESRTTSSHVRACAYTLARWLAGNWWRLRWEPEIRDARHDTDWLAAHSVSNAGEGFAWPTIVFASNGESLAVASIPRLKAESFEPLRYLNTAIGRITAQEFERKTDAFIQSVLERQAAFGVTEASYDLPQLWSEVMEERQNPGMAHWRRLEALCGYDPDEAPEEVIGLLIEDEGKWGSKALEEIAAQSRHHVGAVLTEIRPLTRARRRPIAGGFRCTLPSLRKAHRFTDGLRPWEQAAKLAQAARREWNLGNAPLSSRVLGDLLEIPENAFADHAKKVGTAMPIGVRENETEADFYFNSSWRTSRRFSASRFLGHWLKEGAETERLVPVTEARTADQQFQRAFAQELLCPFEALKEYLPERTPSSDDIEEAAKYFDVSPLVVRTTLVNKGEMDRDALFGLREP